MRIRTIKPDFWTDEKIVELSAWARLLFIGLWNLADDEGRLPYSPKRIKMQLFPADGKIKVAELCAELRRLALICIYESEGKEYLQVINFHNHQRIDKRRPSALPEPDLRNFAPNDAANVLGSGSGSGSGSGMDNTYGKEDLRSWWNDLAKANTRQCIKQVSDIRWQKAKARKIYEQRTEIRLAVDNATPFLKEEKWFNFDWILSEGNLLKLLEGNYSDGNPIPEPEEKYPDFDKKERPRQLPVEEIEAGWSFLGYEYETYEDICKFENEIKAGFVREYHHSKGRTDY